MKIKNYKRKEKKITEEETEKENSTELQKPNIEVRFITTIKSVTEYTYIHMHPQAKSKQSNKNKVQQIDPANKGNQKLYLPEQN